MNIINIIDKPKADELLALGFKYKEKKVQDKIVYEFIGTPELITILNGKFSSRDFFMSRTFNL